MTQGKDEFYKFLTELGGSISKNQLGEIKHSLYGHVDKASIIKIQGSYQLIKELVQKKLVNKNKLEFLKKLIQSTTNNDKLLRIIESFKDQKQPTQDFTKSLIQQKLAGLNVIKDRQQVTYKEYESMLQKHLIQYQALLDERHNTLTNITNMQQDICEIKNKKSFAQNKYQQILQQCKNKENEITKEKKIIQQNQEKEKELITLMKEIEEKLQVRGSSRLSTFERTLAKEQLQTTQENLHELSIEKLNLKHSVKEVKAEYKILIERNHSKLHQLRMLDQTISASYNTLFLHFQQIDKANNIILEKKIKIKKCRLGLSAINEELEVTKKEIENVKNGGTVEHNNENQYLLLQEKIKKDSKVLNYELLGSDTYVLGCKGSSNIHLQFLQPTSIAIDSHGNILINDTGNKRLILINLAGEVLDIILLDVLVANDITFDKDDRIIVIGDNVIRIYKKDILIKQFLPQYIPNKYRLPLLYSLDYNKSTNEMYILDRENLSVQVFGNNGEFNHCKQLSEHLTLPNKIHVLNETEFLISDEFDHTVKHFHFFSPNVHTNKTYGSYGIGLYEFVQPFGITHDMNENIIIADRNNHRIKISDNMGNVITSTGHLGADGNCLNRPCDVAVTSNGFLVISDTDNNRIMIYF